MKYRWIVTYLREEDVPFTAQTVSVIASNPHDALDKFSRAGKIYKEVIGLERKEQLL